MILKCAMGKIMMLVTCILLLILTFIQNSSAQNIPPVSCPQFFEYEAFLQEVIGHISLRHDQQSPSHELVAEFSQRGAYEWEYVGKISLKDGPERTKSNILAGRPINYRVDFPMPTNPPKLTQIRLNNVVLCSASPYPPPRTSIVLTHSLNTQGALPEIWNPRRTPVPVIPQRPSEPFIPQLNESQPVYNIEEILHPEIETPRPRPVTQPQQTDLSERVESMPALTEHSLNSICGRERAVTTPLIFGGEQLQRGQQPWLVGLFEKAKDNGIIFFCGGTLLSSRTVMSAGHCFRYRGHDLPADRTAVSLGRNNIDIVTQGELRDVSELHYHEDYVERSAQADMVLLKMAKQVQFDSNIVPICLWSESFPVQLPSGYKTYVAGWGADGNGNVNTKISKITEVNIVTEANCRHELPKNLVESKTICAKRNNTGPCASDGGGGLMLRENNVWILRGVISLGLTKDNTCDLTKPALYTDVAKHIDWVRQNMWE